MTMVCPSRWASSSASCDLGGDAPHLPVHEPLATDADRVALDADGDAVADFVLRVVGRRQLDIELLGLVQDRQCDRMMELLLGRCCELKDLFRA